MEEYEEDDDASDYCLSVEAMTKEEGRTPDSWVIEEEFPECRTRFLSPNGRCRRCSRCDLIFYGRCGVGDRSRPHNLGGGWRRDPLGCLNRM